MNVFAEMLSKVLRYKQLGGQHKGLLHRKLCNKQQQVFNHFLTNKCTQFSGVFVAVINVDFFLSCKYFRLAKKFELD
jgi:hypothetical protein